MQLGEVYTREKGEDPNAKNAFDAVVAALEAGIEPSVTVGPYRDIDSSEVAYVISRVIPGVDIVIAFTSKHNERPAGHYDMPTEDNRTGALILWQKERPNELMARRIKADRGILGSVNLEALEIIKAKRLTFIHEFTHDVDWSKGVRPGVMDPSKGADFYNDPFEANAFIQSISAGIAHSIDRNPEYWPDGQFVYRALEYTKKNYPDFFKHMNSETKAKLEDMINNHDYNNDNF